MKALSFPRTQVGSIECVGAPWLDAGLGFGGCRWCGRNGKRSQMISHGTEHVHQLGLVLVMHVVFEDSVVGSPANLAGNLRGSGPGVWKTGA